MSAVKLKSSGPVSRSERRATTLTSTACIDAGRKVTHLSVVAQDSSKQATRELRRATARFGEFVDHAGFAAVLLDTDARIKYCNDYLLSITGWTREEVVGESWFETFLPPPHDDSRAVFAALLRDTPAVWHHEGDILTWIGSRVLVRWSNAVVRSSAGQVIGTTSIGEDLRRSGQTHPTTAHASSAATAPRITADQIVAVVDRLRWGPDQPPLMFLRMVADQCAELAEECGDPTSGPAVARHIRQMFRV